MVLNYIIYTFMLHSQNNSQTTTQSSQTTTQSFKQFVTNYVDTYSDYFSDKSIHNKHLKNKTKNPLYLFPSKYLTENVKKDKNGLKIFPITHYSPMMHYLVLRAYLSKNDPTITLIPEDKEDIIISQYIHIFLSPQGLDAIKTLKNENLLDDQGNQFNKFDLVQEYLCKIFNALNGNEVYLYGPASLSTYFDPNNEVKPDHELVYDQISMVLSIPDQELSNTSSNNPKKFKGGGTHRLDIRPHIFKIILDLTAKISETNYNAIGIVKIIADIDSNVLEKEENKKALVYAITNIYYVNDKRKRVAQEVAKIYSKLLRQNDHKKAKVLEQRYNDYITNILEYKLFDITDATDEEITENYIRIPLENLAAANEAEIRLTALNNFKNKIENIKANANNNPDLLSQIITSNQISIENFTKYKSILNNDFNFNKQTILQTYEIYKLYNDSDKELLNKRYCHFIKEVLGKPLLDNVLNDPNENAEQNGQTLLTQFLASDPKLIAEECKKLPGNYNIDLFASKLMASCSLEMIDKLTQAQEFEKSKQDPILGIFRQFARWIVVTYHKYFNVEKVQERENVFKMFKSVVEIHEDALSNSEDKELEDNSSSASTSPEINGMEQVVNKHFSSEQVDRLKQEKPIEKGKEKI